jgi:hypothetical protein
VAAALVGTFFGILLAYGFLGPMSNAMEKLARDETQFYVTIKTCIMGFLHKIGRVVGLASSVLLKPEEPQSSVNRRISIVVLNKRTEAAINAENGTLLQVIETTKPFAPANADAASPSG